MHSISPSRRWPSRPARRRGAARIAALSTLTLALLWPLAASAVTGPARGRDGVRGIWVTRWDYQSAHDIRTVMKNCASLGLDRVYLQVRGQADAYYRSELEPWGEKLGGAAENDGDPGFDPLALAIREARRHDLELYAWINVLPGWRGKKPPRDRTHLVHRHPEWFLRDREGQRPLCVADTYTILNPCLPDVRKHLARVAADIARRYEIDGLQLDYIRFLDRVESEHDDVPYDTPTLARFREQTGGFPSRFPRQWDRFRRDAVDRVVEAMARAARQARPGLRLSVAAIHDLEKARHSLFQDAPRWLRSGWIDEICPMLYTDSDEKLREWIARWCAAAPRSRLVIGLGLYRVEDGAAARRQIALARDAGTGGVCFFSYLSCFLSRSPECRRDAAAAERRAQMRKAVARAAARPADVETAAR